MIFLTSATYNPIGHVAMNATMPLNLGRRTTTQRTLDGGIVTYDFGYNVGDADFELVDERPTEDQITRVQSMLTLHSSHKLYVPGHVYKGVLTRFSYSQGNPLRVRFQITETEV